MIRRYIYWIHCLTAIASLFLMVSPGQAEEGHMHGPDGKHIAVAGSLGGGSGPSILSHHDLKITDMRQPGPDGEGTVVKGCDIHSVIHRKGDPDAVIHREHNAYEPENGVYGSHMMYKEPGEYVIVEKITMPDKKEYTLEFPIWVPDPNGEQDHHHHGIPLLRYTAGGLGGILLLSGAFLLGRRSSRRAIAGLSALALLGSVLPFQQAEAEEEEGHMHGPDGRHIAVAGKFGEVRIPLRAYPTPDGKDFASQTRDHYRFRLSIENEEIQPDPDVVSLSESARTAIGLQVIAAQAKRLGSGLTATGQVVPNPNRTVTISSRVGARVVRIDLTPGDRIPAGHIVAVLDSTEVAEAQATLARSRSEMLQVEAFLGRAKAEARRAQAQVAEARAALDRARAESDAARGKAESLRKNLERQRQMADVGAFSQGPVEAARSALADAEGELHQAEAEVSHLENQLQRMEEGAKSGVVARKDMEAARTAAAQGRTRVLTAQKQHEIAHASFLREEQIQKKGLRSAREVQQAEADLESAQIAVRSAEAVVVSYERAVQAAQAREEAARSELSEARTGIERAHLAGQSALSQLLLLGASPGGGSQITLRTPIGGEVATRSVSAGEVVAAGQTICTIFNTDTVWVESDIYEKDLPGVRIGQRVLIATDALPGRTFEGRVDSISGQVNKETRTVRVRTAVANRGRVLKPNMFARVMISSGSGSTLTLPMEAIQEDGGEQVVFLEESPGAYRRCAVRVGRTLGQYAVVESGIKPGARIVTQGSYQLLAKAKQG